MKKSRFFKVASVAAVEAQKDKSFFEKIKLFFEMMIAFKKRIYKPNIQNLIIGFFAVFYIISPIDFIPEAFFGPFGIIDDLGIFFFGMRYFNKEIASYLEWKNTQKVYDSIEDAKIMK